MNAIDNEETLFYFDAYDASSSGRSSHSTNHTPGPFPSLECTFRSTDFSEDFEDNTLKGKGKANSSLGRTDTDRTMYSQSSQTHSPSSHSAEVHISRQSKASGVNTRDSKSHDNQAKGKSKAIDLPPTLPPLDLNPTGFDYDVLQWPSFSVTTAGPSSYGSEFMPALSSSPQSDISVRSHTVSNNLPSRRHSFSNVSTHSTNTAISQSTTRIKFRTGHVGKTSSNLTNKFLSETEVSLTKSDIAEASQGSIIPPWLAEANSSGQFYDAVESISLPLDLSNTFCTLKGKGRSYSSPLPPKIVAQTSSDHFDGILPKELRLQVLSSLVALHEHDHENAKSSGLWCFTQASSSKNKWVGKERGIRELIKFSRVSKSWQTLVFDGTLWRDFDVHAFPHVAGSLLVQLTKITGPIVKSINLAGHAQVTSTNLFDITSNLSIQPPTSYSLLPLPHTQLVSLNLRGCALLTTSSLHHIIMRSPSLTSLCLRGLKVVTNTTCDILAMYTPHLSVLDISQCRNLDGNGVRNLAGAALTRHEHLALKELRAVGLKYVTDQVMETLGKAAPYLEVLDLSYSRHLHNSALDAFVACDSDYFSHLGVDTVVLNARDIGRDYNDSTKYRRRITRLRHLSLSSCILLTDGACSNLSHSVPKLEFLELGGIGGEMKDDGLVRLLRTTPNIRRLDIEDASDISDSVIAAVTPIIRAGQLSGPGHALEHIIMSYAGNVTEEVIVSMIRQCPRLKILEADNTKIGPAALKEFVNLSRERQMQDAKVVTLDCRGVSESLIRELSSMTRPRLGWREYGAKKLKYLDGRDDAVESLLKVGQDECDESRVVLKSFYSWLTVDAVAAAQERKKTALRRAVNGTSGSERSVASGTRWWTPGGRRMGRTNTPPMEDTDDGCTIM